MTISHFFLYLLFSVVVSVNEEGDPTIWNVTLELSTSIIDDSDSINNTPGTAAAQVTTTATTVNASTAKKRGRPKKIFLYNFSYRQKHRITISYVDIAAQITTTAANASTLRKVVDLTRYFYITFFSL